MARWLGFLVALGLVAGSPPAADAQVFKPKVGKKSEGGAKKAPKKAAKKTPPKTAKKASSKRSPAAERGRPGDLTPEPATREDQDFVKITDDDEIE